MILLKKRALFLQILLLSILMGESLLGQGYPDLQSKSWQVLSDSQQGPNRTGMTDHTLHFYPNGQLLIETANGNFWTSFSTDQGTCLLAGQAFEVSTLEDQAFTLQRLADSRSWTLKERTDVVLPDLTKFPKKTGGFRLDGCYYYQENSTPVSYHYYRFYPDGNQILFHTIIPPDQIATFLNKAYVTNEEEVRGFELASSAVTDESINYSYVATRRERTNGNGKTELLELNRSTTFSIVADSLRMHEVNVWNYDDTPYERERMLAFLPLPSLSRWEGLALSPGNPGTADEYLALQKIPEPEVVLKVVDEMPRFPGCEDNPDEVERKQCSQQELLKFIYMNIRYPSIARENGVQGTVVVTFVIEKDGRVSNARVVRDIGAQCGQEALRVVELMQDQNILWAPGKMYGSPVRVQFNLPVKFKLEGRTRKKKRRRGN